MEAARYLSPHQFSQSEEDAPHPLLQVQGLTAEGLPAKLHDHDLGDATETARLFANAGLEMSRYL